MSRPFASLIVAVAVGSVATAVQADLAKVQDRTEFVDLVAGKTLTLPLVRLTVKPDGTISGKGARWDVSGNWTWQDGYFCREIFWGGDPLGYNCQEVRFEDGRMRFTSDRGAGASATFRVK